jgi:hypothetical protein
VPRSGPSRPRNERHQPDRKACELAVAAPDLESLVRGLRLVW